jgi:hypothetical protein
MAQKTIVELIDDLDGKSIPDGSGETVLFALDGVQYEIDLASKNAGKLRNDLDRYVKAGRRVGRPETRRGPRVRRSTRTPTRRDALQTKAIRTWAMQNGYEVSERGRISASIVEAYEAAH